LQKKSGAQFIVSPDTNEEIIKATVAGGMVSVAEVEALASGNASGRVQR